MTLAQVLRELGLLNDQLEQSQKRLARVEKEGEKLAEQLNKSKKHTADFGEAFKGILTDKMLARYQKSKDLEHQLIAMARSQADERVKLGQQWIQDLDKAREEHEKLAQLAARHNALVSSGNMFYHKRREYDEMVKTSMEYQHALSVKDTKLASQKLAYLKSITRNEKDQAVIAFRGYQERKKQEDAAFAARERAIKSEEKYDKASRALSAFKRKISLTHLSKELGITGIGEAKAGNFGEGIGLIASGLAGVLRTEIKWIGEMGERWLESNTALIEANSQLKTRIGLIRTNLQIDQQLGVGSKKILEAQAALLNVGQKNLALDQRRVKTLTMLNVGLGMSVKDAAQLSLFSELTRNNFEDVGDALAIVVDRTNLTAADAVKMSNSIARVQRGLGLTADNSLPRITEAMGVYEGTLKRLGADDGAVSRLIERFSSLKDVNAAIVLGGTGGVISPADFKNTDKMLEMLRHTGEVLTKQMGDARENTTQYAVMLDQLSRTWHMSKFDIKAFMDAAKPEKFAEIVKQVKNIQQATDALAERTRNQLLSSTKPWTTLLNQMKADFQYFLIPHLEYAAKKWREIGTWILNLTHPFVQQQETAAALEAYRQEVRKKYGIIAEKDPAFFFRWQRTHMAPLPTVATSVPYQPTVMPQPNITVSAADPGHRQLEVLAFQFSNLRNSIDGVKSEIGKTTEKQIQSDQKLAKDDQSQQRLQHELDALHRPATTTYGLEVYGN